MLDRLAIGRRRNRGATLAASGRAAVDRWSAASSASGIGQRIAEGFAHERASRLRLVDRVVGVRDGEAARLAVPDPRWFALQKLWMAERLERNPQKRRKDRKQGITLFNAVRQAMPHYPLDAAFYDQFPEPLKPHFELRDAQKPA